MGGICSDQDPGCGRDIGELAGIRATLVFYESGPRLAECLAALASGLSSAFGEGVPELLNELGRADGISVVVTEKFAPDATEFTAQMLNIRNARADMNLIWGIPPAAALAQKAYRQLGITAPVMQSHGIGNQVFLDTAGASADGLLAPLGRLLVADQLPDDDPQKEVITQFMADYDAEYGEKPSTFA